VRCGCRPSEVPHLLRAPPHETEHALCSCALNCHPPPPWAPGLVSASGRPVVRCGLGRPESAGKLWTLRIIILLPSSGWKNVGGSSPLPYNAVKFGYSPTRGKTGVFFIFRVGEDAKPEGILSPGICCFLSRYSFTLKTDWASSSETSGCASKDAAMLFSSTAVRPPANRRSRSRLHYD
jgi:hypothetical protein